MNIIISMLSPSSEQCSLNAVQGPEKNLAQAIEEPLLKKITVKYL